MQAFTKGKIHLFLESNCANLHTKSLVNQFMHSATNITHRYNKANPKYVKPISLKTVNMSYAIWHFIHKDLTQTTVPQNGRHHTGIFTCNFTKYYPIFKILSSVTTTTTTTILRLCGICPGKPGWAGTRRTFTHYSHRSHQSSLSAFSI